MERLTYTALEQGRYDGYLLRQPLSGYQFGEGNFLRGFAEHFIDVMNERTDFQGKVVVVPRLCRKDRPHQRSGGALPALPAGRRNGETVDQCRIVSCISRAVDVFEEYDAFLRTAHNPNMRFILSNTTEAGIVYEPSSRMDDRPRRVPAKLARLLWERYQTGLPGYIIFPCELIADNGGTLRDCVLRHARDWGWRRAFPLAGGGERLCSTLVDRIVTGYSPEQAGRWRRPQAWRTSCWMWRSPSPSGLLRLEWVQGSSRRSRPVCPCALWPITALPGAEGAHSQRGHTVLTRRPSSPGTRWCAPAWRTGAEELPGWGAVSGDYPHTLPPGRSAGLRPGGGGAV